MPKGIGYGPKKKPAVKKAPKKKPAKKQRSTMGWLTKGGYKDRKKKKAKRKARKRAASARKEKAKVTYIEDGKVVGAPSARAVSKVATKKPSGFTAQAVQAVKQQATQPRAQPRTSASGLSDYSKETY